MDTPRKRNEQWLKLVKLPGVVLVVAVYGMLFWQEGLAYALILGVLLLLSTRPETTSHFAS